MSRWRSSSSALLDPLAQAAREGCSRRATPAADHQRAALSRPGRARHAVAGARRRRARDAAHGRHRRGDAAAGDEGADDQRPRAGRRSLAAWTMPSTASTRRSSSMSPSSPAAASTSARPARHGDRLVLDQSRARRRHHRQEPQRARGQEGQAQAAVLAPRARPSSRRSTGASWTT